MGDILGRIFASIVVTLFFAWIGIYLMCIVKLLIYFWSIINTIEIRYVLYFVLLISIYFLYEYYKENLW